MRGEKGAPYHLPNPLYPENYLLAILKAEQARGVVIIPTIPMILYRLCREWERRVLLFYPEDGLREEYRQRYLGRGNRAEFLELFLGRWENYLDSFRELEERGCGIHIRLKSGEYLSHYRELYQRFDQPGNLETIYNGPDRLIFLGDYIDRGPESCKALYLPSSLQQCCPERIIVLWGNHKEMLLKSHRPLIDWLRKLPFYYETETQIFVQEWTRKRGNIGSGEPRTGSTPKSSPPPGGIFTRISSQGSGEPPGWPGT